MQKQSHKGIKLGFDLTSFSIQCVCATNTSLESANSVPHTLTYIYRHAYRGGRTSQVREQAQ